MKGKHAQKNFGAVGAMAGAGVSHTRTGPGRPPVAQIGSSVKYRQRSGERGPGREKRDHGPERTIPALGEERQTRSTRLNHTQAGPWGAVREGQCTLLSAARQM